MQSRIGWFALLIALLALALPLLQNHSSLLQSRTTASKATEIADANEMDGIAIDRSQVGNEVVVQESREKAPETKVASTKKAAAETTQLLEKEVARLRSELAKYQAHEEGRRKASTLVQVPASAGQVIRPSTLAQATLDGGTGSDDLNDSSTLTCLVYDDSGTLVARFSGRVGCLRDHKPWGPIQMPVVNKNAPMSSLVRGRVVLKISGDTDCWRTSFFLKMKGTDQTVLTAGMDAIELRTNRGSPMEVGIEGILKK